MPEKRVLERKQMSRFYHPQESAPMDSGGGGVSGGMEMSNAGLSAGVELHIQAPVESTGSQLAQQAFDFHSAGVNAVSQPFMSGRPGMEALLPNTSIGGFEATAFTGPPVGGADSALMAGLVPGANEPLSPLIQLILRMPGAMGLMHSVVDFFAAFFHHMTHTAFNLFDPSFLAQQAQGAMGSLAKGAMGHGGVIQGSVLGHGAVGHIGLSQHFPVSMSLLPSNAPIFQALGTNFTPMGSDLLSAKLNGSLYGGSGAAPDLSGSGSLTGSDHLQVSGHLDPTKAQFEQMGSGTFGSGGNPHTPQLAGPSLSDSVGKGHLASNNRLFCDQITSGKGTQQFVSNSQTPTTPSQFSSLSQSGNSMGSLPSSFNVNGNALGQSASSLPAVARVEDGLLNGVGTPAEAGYSMGSPSGTLEGGPDLGPSGAVSNRLGGQQLLADSRGVDTFRPSYSGVDSGRSLSDMQPRSADAGYGTASDTGSMSSAAGKGGATVGGMKAKQLSLDGIDKGASVKSSAAGAAKTSAAKAPTPKADPTPHATHSTQSTMDGISHGHKAGHHSGSSASDHVSHGKGAAHGNGHDNISHRVTPKVQYHSDKLASASKAPEAHAVKPVAPQKHVETYTPQPQAADQSQTVQDQFQGDQTQVQPAVDAAGNPIEQVEAQPTAYTIKSGDCLWNIAKDKMGDGLKWNEIYDMNKDVLGSNPDLIRPGTTIQLPGTNELASQAGDVTKYIVKPGDNLWNISKDLMGGGDKWGQLYQANHDVIGANPRLIFPGQELNIPGTGDGASNVLASGGPDPSQQVAAAQGQPAVDAGGQQTAAAPDAQPQGQTVEQGVANYDPSQYQGMPSQMPAQNMPASQVQTMPATMPQTQVQPAAQPGLPQAQAPQGLPVLPPNTPTPVLMNPAQAAVPAVEQSGATAGVVSSNMAINLADYLRKNR